MRPPMRSSIACLKCRKSKIKCENNGGTSPCEGCLKSGKDCKFQLPEATTAPPKRSLAPQTKQEQDGGTERKKLRKIEEFSRVDTQKAAVYAEEVLAAPFLSEELWESLLDLYTLHFAPELSFLHLPTIKEELGRRFKSSEPGNAPSDINLVLLGVLALTARFHTDLVKYLAHVCNNAQSSAARSRPGQIQTDPASASQYYADILKMALMRSAMEGASVEKVQASLMLALYEWGQTRPNTGGFTAWMYVGQAIRMAQFLRLNFEERPLEVGDPKRHTQQYRSRTSSSQSQFTLEKEVRRRTMFSCFILDTMLACGKERLSIIRSEDLRIQLPCSELKFDLVMEARTSFIYQPGGTSSGTTDDSVLSQFIRLVDLWGDISRYSCAGGRLTEQNPPWKETTFRGLHSRLQEFEDNLPEAFVFSRSNYFKHEKHQALSVYILLHMLRNVCLIMLHREYIPFVPIRCSQPEGPLDRPTFAKGEAPEGFWLDSAEFVFKAAREIADLVDICQKKDKLPQSTIVLFAIWTAAFVGLYGHHFPQMDTEGHLRSFQWNEPQPGDAKSDVFQHGPTGLAFQTLNKMSVWLKMASTYVKLLEQMDTYFTNIKRDYSRHSSKVKPSERSSLSVRLGGRGGGLEEYQKMVKPMKDFGALHPDDQGHFDSLDGSRASTVERDSSTGAESRSTYAMDRTRSPRSTPSASFTAINQTPVRGDQDSQTPSDVSGPPHEVPAEHWSRQPQTARPLSSPHPMSAPAALNTAEQVSHAPIYTQATYDIDCQESKRFGETNDLGIFTQNDTFPFGGYNSFMFPPLDNPYNRPAFDPFCHPDLPPLPYGTVASSSQKASFPPRIRNKSQEPYQERPAVPY